MLKSIVPFPGFPAGWSNLQRFSLRRHRVWKNTFGTAVVEWSNGSTKKRTTPRLPRAGGCTLKTRWLVRTRILTRMSPGKNMACWNGRWVTSDRSRMICGVCCAEGFQPLCKKKKKEPGQKVRFGSETVYQLANNGYGFVIRQRLRFFLCPMLVSSRLSHLSHLLPSTKFNIFIHLSMEASTV